MLMAFNKELIQVNLYTFLCTFPSSVVFAMFEFWLKQRLNFEFTTGRKFSDIYTTKLKSLNLSSKFTQFVKSSDFTW